MIQVISYSIPVLKLSYCTEEVRQDHAIKVNWIFYARIHSIYIQINTGNNLLNIVAVIYSKYYIITILSHSSFIGSAKPGRTRAIKSRISWISNWIMFP